MKGWPPPKAGTRVKLDAATQKAMNEVYSRLVRETAAIVEQHWAAITPVAKHLENHDRIDDQATLDQLIERAERVALATQRAANLP